MLTTAFSKPVHVCDTKIASTCIYAILLKIYSVCMYMYVIFQKFLSHVILICLELLVGWIYLCDISTISRAMLVELQFLTFVHIWLPLFTVDKIWWLLTVYVNRASIPTRLSILITNDRLFSTPVNIHNTKISNI